MFCLSDFVPNSAMAASIFQEDFHRRFEPTDWIHLRSQHVMSEITSRGQHRNSLSETALKIHREFASFPSYCASNGQTLSRSAKSWDCRGKWPIGTVFIRGKCRRVIFLYCRFRASRFCTFLEKGWFRNRPNGK